MMNSEVGIVPVAAVCDRRRPDPKNPTERWSVAAFVTNPQIEPVTPTFQSPRQSSLIKPNQAISCRGAIQSRSPSCSKIPTSSVLLRQTRSKPVKVLFNSHRQGKNAAGLAIYCGLPRTIYNRWWFAFAADTAIRGQSAICNPQSAIPLDSTWFHLIPLNST